jgi:histidine triad (HIT) family protein
MNKINKNCIFCKIIINRDTNNTEFLFENENTVVLFDIKPLSKGHVLIITKNHYENLLEINYNDWNSIFFAFKYISNKLNEDYSPKGFNFISNIGEEAYQSIKHLHIHLVPKYEKNLGFIWPDHQ